MCVSFYYFPDSRRSCHSCRIWKSLAYFPDFPGSVRTKKSMNGVYKTNIDCSFIREKVENYCTLGETQPWPILFTSALRASVNSRPGLGFTSGQLFSTIPLMSSQYLYTVPLIAVSAGLKGKSPVSS